MNFKIQNYKKEDYTRIENFLSETLIQNGLTQKCWHVARWNYWRWHVVENITNADLEKVVKLWVTAEDQIVAVLHPEGDGEAFFEVSPLFKSEELEHEMLTKAEENLAEPVGEGQYSLKVWSFVGDTIREKLLLSNGYVRQENPEYCRWRDLELPIDNPSISAGYLVKPLGNEIELPSRCWASWRAFHPDEPDSNYKGWEWYLNVQKAPGYRKDFDLVSVSPTGDIAGFCTVWLDESTKTGVFEPVGVVPEHKRRGLGKAMMCEGLRLLKKSGAIRAFVGSYGPIAHALYESAGFTNIDLSASWKKIL